MQKLSICPIFRKKIINDFFSRQPSSQTSCSTCQDCSCSDYSENTSFTTSCSKKSHSHHSHARDEDNDETESEISMPDSPQTAWRRNTAAMPSFGQQPMQRDDSSSSSSDEESSTTSDAESIVSQPHHLKKDSKPSAVHMDGYFRNLNAINGDRNTATTDSEEEQSRPNTVAPPKTASFKGYSPNKAAPPPPKTAPPPPPQRIKPKHSVSSSASSSCSSTLSEDSVATKRKGNRPAYSESNMHNSLGYLP